MQKARVLDLLEERDRLKKLELARTKFLPFVQMVWPDFIAGPHHQIVAEALEEMADGALKRLIISMPPRHTKSEFASWLFPAWFLGRFPKKKIIQASNTEALASGFGRRVRNLIDGTEGVTEDGTGGSDAYRQLFPNVRLAPDSKAAAGWHTNFGGEYFAIGTSGRVTGKGADCAYFACKCLTKRGYVPIADVRVGEEVLGYDHATERPVWTRVRAISTQRKPELVDINGFLCTPEHQVYTRGGYRRALAARDAGDDVLSLRDVHPQGRNGLPTPGTTERPQRSATQSVLFRRVSAKPEYPCVPAMRGLESPDGDNLQGLLPEGQTRPADLYALRENDQAHEVRADQEHQNLRRHWQRLLRSYLLPTAQGEPAETRYSGVHGLQDLRRPGTAKRWAVLFDEVLQRACEEAGRFFLPVQWALEPGTPTDQGTIQRRLRDLREREATRTGAPYRPRLDAPPQTQSGSTLRTMPRVLSSVDDGICARSFEELLQGTGFWVVDIQTDSSNFFCEGVLAHNCLIIDDPHSEQEAKQAETSPDIFDDVYEWFTSGPRQRLQPGGSILLVQTRWSKRDLAGQVLRKESQQTDGRGDKWRVINLPAILDEYKVDADGKSMERSLWPGYWPLETLRDTRADIPVSKWQAQYQQAPTSEAAAILKRDYWRIWGATANEGRANPEKCPGPRHLSAWENDSVPACDYIIGSWDCAATAQERSHPSAYTLWGVFRAEDPTTGKEVNNIILLQAYKARMEFPELKKRAGEFYNMDRPDTLLIENKSAGMQLIQEFRSMGIPAESFTGSSRGSRTMPNDKVARANMIADIFASRYVWRPERRFADEVVEQCASFPAGDEDDLVDSTVQAMLRFREGGLIRTANDEEEDANPTRFRRKRFY